MLVLVFQHGFGKGLLGFSSTAGIDPVVPLLLFVILFGLSMDYHVFIISRIRETFDRGASMDDAISHGIKSTAGVVTSAAIVMVAVFSIFATLSMLFFKQFGVGLAVAILIDATIVRAVLLPAIDEAARRLELVPARVARVAASARASRGRSRTGDQAGARLRIDRQREQRKGSKIMTVSATILRRLALPSRSEGSLPPASSPSRSSGCWCSASRICDSAPTAARLPCPRARTPASLTLEPCHYGTENGSYPADCGTLVVPENRADPQSRLIALPVTRIRARSEHPGTPVFRLEGGPGITNMKFSKASRIADNHDVVLVGYRGVDGSVRLDCPEVVSALKRSDRFPRREVLRMRTREAFRSCAKRLQADGVDLAGYTLPQRVDDLEAARVALGYKRDRPRQRERRHPHRD